MSDETLTERERMAQALYEAKCRFMRVAPYLWKTLIQDEWISIADAALAFNAGISELVTPKRPTLWSWVKRLHSGRIVQVTLHRDHREKFTVSDGQTMETLCAGDKGKTWTDLPAGPRRPKVGKKGGGK
jgi:hypothetical protein